MVGCGLTNSQRSDKRVQAEAPRCGVVHIRHGLTGNPLIDFSLMSSPAPSTIDNVIRSDASSPQKHSLAAPLTAMDLEQVLQQFPDPTQPPDDDNDVSAPKPIAGQLDPVEPVVVWTVASPELIPYTVDLSDYSPMRVDDSEVHLSCNPGGPHCAELDRPWCAVC